MYRPILKLLSIVLIFLLAISPLQSVIADILASVDQTETPCHMLMNPSGMVEVIQPSMNDCDMCVSANDCNGSCVTFGHCASNIVGLLQGLLPFANIPDSFSIIHFDEERISQQPPALYRPPRV